MGGAGHCHQSLCSSLCVLSVTKGVIPRGTARGRALPRAVCGLAGEAWSPGTHCGHLPFIPTEVCCLGTRLQSCLPRFTFLTRGVCLHSLF